MAIKSKENIKEIVYPVLMRHLTSDVVILFYAEGSGVVVSGRELTHATGDHVVDADMNTFDEYPHEVVISN